MKEPRLEDVGIYKAKAIRWHVKLSKSSAACAITVMFRVHERLQDGAWETVSQEVVWGDFWVIGTSGDPVHKICQNIKRVLGWDGSLDLDSNPLRGNPTVQVTVKCDDYNGYYKVSWLNPGDYVPEKRKKREDAPDGKALNDKHGKALKDAIGSATRDDPRDADINPDEVPF